MVRLRLSTYGIRKEAEPEAELDEYVSRIHDLLGEYVLATEDLPVPAIVLSRLKERGETLATAESCTGGYLAHLLTRIACESVVFAGKVVAYAKVGSASFRERVGPDE